MGSSYRKVIENPSSKDYYSQHGDTMTLSMQAEADMRLEKLEGSLIDTITYPYAYPNITTSATYTVNNIQLDQTFKAYYKKIMHDVTITYRTVDKNGFLMADQGAIYYNGAKLDSGSVTPHWQNRESPKYTWSVFNNAYIISQVTIDGVNQVLPIFETTFDEIKRPHTIEVVFERKPSTDTLFFGGGL